MKYTDAIRAHDLSDALDTLWANAADAAPRSRPSDQAATRPAASRFDRISQEHRDGGTPNKLPPRNSMTRQCYGCAYLKTFKPRPDEQERYGFGEIGYGCREPGYEGYVNPQKPICIRGPFLKESA